MNEHWLVKKAKKEIEEALARKEQAYQKIPPMYHQFLVLLSQSKKIGRVQNKEEIPVKLLRELGMWISDGMDVYVTLEYPYVTVDGRVQWARDEHRQAKKKLEIETVYDPNLKVVRTKVVSEMLGSATATAIVNIGGSGVDRTNPIENAETSSIGRCLSFLGYGLVGTGIASAEEVSAAMVETHRLSEERNTRSNGEVIQNSGANTVSQPSTPKNEKEKQQESPVSPDDSKNPSPQTVPSDSSSPKNDNPSPSQTQFIGLVRVMHIEHETRDSGIVTRFDTVDEENVNRSFYLSKKMTERIKNFNIQVDDILNVMLTYKKENWVLADFVVVNRDQSYAG